MEWNGSFREEFDGVLLKKKKLAKQKLLTKYKFKQKQKKR